MTWTRSDTGLPHRWVDWVRHWAATQVGGLGETLGCHTGGWTGSDTGLPHRWVDWVRHWAATQVGGLGQTLGCHTGG